MFGKHQVAIGLCAVLAFTALFLATARTASAEDEDDDRWPMKIVAPEGTIYIYQPQIEKFEADILTSRAAVSFTPQGTEDPVFGAAWFKARIHTDREERLVTFEDLEVSDAKFPEATPEQIEKFGEIVRQHVMKAEMTLSLDRLLASLELAEKEKLATANFKNDPPKIFVREHPALLVQLDGEPQLLKVEGTEMMRVVNTPFYILYDPKGKTYYLSGGGSWVSTQELTGGWQTEKSLPAAVAKVAAEDPNAPKVEEGDTKLDSLPEIVVSTEPAELLQTDGAPKYTPIDGTMLLRVSNTENDILMEIASQEYFVLLSGRWFKAKSLTKGPWSFVLPTALPEDFKKIPANEESTRIRASVAGTIEAREAVTDTYIPQTASVNRKEAKLEVTYDGEPKFEPVEETSIQYSVNTSFSVFLVNGLYYCCNDAVWFVGPSPTGPWEVATEVPAEIYTTPPSNPNYNTTYVHVYHSTPSVVYVGYYPGYVGCYPYYGTVCYGTGWWYRPWYGRYYYPRPCTFGFGIRYNPWTGGWGVGIGFRGPLGGYVGIGVGGAWLAGGVARAAWWGNGGFRRNDINININNSFNRGGNRSGNKRGGNNNLYNRRKDVDRTRDKRPSTRDRTAGGDRRPGKADRASPGTRDRKNNVYADKNGNVFKRDDKGWQKRDGNKWKDTTGKDRASAKDRAATRDRSATNRPSTRDRSATNRKPGDRTSTGDRTKAGDRKPTTRDRSGTSRSSSSNRSRSSSSFNRSQMERSHQSRQRGSARSSSSRSRSSGSRSRSSGGSRGGGSRGGGGGRR